MRGRIGRRGFLAAVGGAAIGAACGKASGAGPAATTTTVLPAVARDDGATVAPQSPTATPASPPPATPTPPPVRPAAAYQRSWLPGTPWETTLFLKDSGLRGETVMVLGGVHGNEPGAWMAADQVATWTPATGSLLVAPRVNRLAINSFVRTFDELGDLNRLYPGDPASSFPMERMAAEITASARELGVTLLIDMHESWAFWVDAPATGTAALGQTLTTGVGPRATLGQAIAGALNDSLPAHDRLVVRDGTSFRRPEGTPGTGAQGRGRSSLALGGYVPGLTPLLVEMGQQAQAVERRVELHLAIARSALRMVGLMSA